jgi:hypothetical protein
MRMKHTPMHLQTQGVRGMALLLILRMQTLLVRGKPLETY